MDNVLKLARPSILKLAAYQSARSLALEAKVFLDANEAPDGTEGAPQWNRYPEPQPRALVDRLARLYGVLPSQLLVTRGIDEAIDLLIRGFCEPGRDGILICPPTYGMYEVSARISGVNVAAVPLELWASDFSRLEAGLNIEEIVAAACSRYQPVKIVFICSPNNPTGTAFSSKTIEVLCRALDGRSLVAVDEAYIEFCQPASSLAQLLEQHPNLVVLRTLSKAWGLAGLRVGSLIAQAPVVELLQKVRAPYPIARPVVMEACSELSQSGLARFTERVAGILRERERVRQALLEFPEISGIFSSSANFLLVRFGGAEKIHRILHQRGILVRDRSGEPGLDDCLRISIGSESDNERLLAALRETVQC